MKLWGGRFQKETDRLVEDFHSSITFDQRLYRYDILGSIAHATMLGECGIIQPAEAALIVQSLREVLAELEAGQLELEVGCEDIHMNVEKILIQRLGEVGKKLHTGRSRNDQVALDVRMFLKEEIREIQRLLSQLQEVLLNLAEEHLETILPGYTHLQKAQPISLAHHFLAYVQMFNRDLERLSNCYTRTDEMPLGSGALATTTFPIDRYRVAELLGFAAITENSLDGVSDRDFAVEFCAAASLIMLHLSRFSEELILWSTDEFQFVEMDDAYSTGSSIMPQKKNPDVAELVRGKTGRVYGDLMALLTVLKGLPLAYNKDLQEDKEALFDAVDTVKKCLLVFAPLLKTIKIKAERMREGAGRGFTNATDLADYLVRRGLPFRSAHEVVGRLVLYCTMNNKTLEELSLAELNRESGLAGGPDNEAGGEYAAEPAGSTQAGGQTAENGWFEPQVYAAIRLETCVALRRVPGGPAPDQLRLAITRARDKLQKFTAF